MALGSEEMLLLGRIDGKLDSIVRRLDGVDQRFDRVESRLDGMDGRLRDVEKKAATFGAVAGGAVSVGTAIIVEGLRHVMRGAGGAIGLGN